MQYRRLGRTDIEVSALCLGTMTFGEQNTESEAHQQLDAALAADINFIDTAEMYPVPPKGETQGLTEAYIGSWLKARNNRNQVILATKVSGPSAAFTHLRGGKLGFDRNNIKTALNDSLKRLQTDYVDLYQLHWPERSTNYFGQLGYQHHADEQFTAFEEVLAVLGELIQAGKIRHIGLSNETPWGTMRLLQLAEQLGLPRVASIQNPYNLLNRSFEVGLAEIAHREDVGLLAYSPLGFGVLSGKYLDGPWPADARLTLFDRFVRYVGERGVSATHAYVSLARSHGLEPAQMALAYVTSRPFVTSNIIGATNMAQLQQNIDSAELSLSADVLDAIETLHQQHTYPCP